jgi:hypothetical protein
MFNAAWSSRRIATTVGAGLAAVMLPHPHLPLTGRGWARRNATYFEWSRVCSLRVCGS